MHQLCVICEECGRKYLVDISRIQGAAAGFSCRSCGHRMLVARPPGSRRARQTPVESAAGIDANGERAAGDRGGGRWRQVARRLRRLKLIKAVLE